MRITCIREEDSLPAQGSHSLLDNLPRYPPYSLSHHTAASFQVEDDNGSIPSYENQVQPCIPDEDNDDNYVPPYIAALKLVSLLLCSEVLPDAPLTNQGNEDCASTGSIVQYENVLESQRHSPGEYVNVLDPETTILDPCFVGTSDRESEDDTPDYENVCPGL
ncbi:linker for activation of T-cells family member 1 isoform X3 [Rhineura floridana]|uniref:linker for activation of T-cells family member 1 isoform X3 n=1 Tax=Rhineura floridana TaxID=261503 RepID=UPI002AC8285A|nr:linker for activation of T-cells family member 1 isoform X3 [Rhineura floridana]